MSLSTSSDTPFLDNNEKLRVYEWGQTKGKTLQESGTILLKKAPGANVATAVPINVNKNTAFVVDTLGIGHPDNLKADELGSWHCTGVKSAYFHVKLMKARKVSA